MKIDFDGAVRVLDQQHVKLKHAVAIQEYTGLAVFAWQEALTGFGNLTEADVKEAGEQTEMPALAALKVMKKTAMFSDPAWITNMAAAHWLMLAQNEQDVPPLDDDYDPDVLGFAVAYMTALFEDAKAKRVPDKPDPTARPARRAPSSRRTAAPKTPKTVKGEAVPLPRLTGS